jgi:hypothetical protein
MAKLSQELLYISLLQYLFLKYLVLYVMSRKSIVELIQGLECVKQA